MGKLTDKYPHVTQACLEIAYDNGGVHRDRPEEKVRKEIKRFLDKTPYVDHLAEMDKWLSTLSEEDLLIVAGGEESEIEALMATAPPFTNTLLNDYFDEVC